MTTPHEEQPQEQAPVTPTVTTAPPRSRWRWGSVPTHLGPARTSTVVLAVLFLALGALYLNVRPETAGTTTTSNTGVEQPAPQPTTPGPTTAPASTTTPAPTTGTPEPTTSAPTTPTTATSAPSSSAPGETTTTTPSSPPSSTLLPTPTTGGSPTG